MPLREIRRGNQRPTFSTVGEWAYSDGGFAVEMFGHYGVKFYESQDYELRVFLARNEDGSFAAKTICVSKPRQNGKSFAARHYAVWMAAIEGKHVLFSAHHGKTVRKMFKELKNLVEGNSDLKELLLPNGKGIYSGAGSEGIYFVDEYGNPGGFIEFQTRTNSAARGETYQVIIIDEAQELTDEQLEAIKPTTLAASDVNAADSDPQMIYLGTPPGPKCPGTVFRDLHDRAHEGTGGGVWWMEWAVENVPDFSDRDAVMELVYLTNPAMGYRIKESTMLDAMDTMKPDGFARECLGWWSAAILLAALNSLAWKACATEKPPDGGLKIIAVKCSPDDEELTIAVCSKPDDGKPHVELLLTRQTADGITDIADMLVGGKGSTSLLVIDGQGTAKTLGDMLEKRRYGKKAICFPSSAEVASACSTLANAVNEGAVTHFAQDDLDKAAMSCGKRRIGTKGGWGFDGDGATLLEAVALAYWGAINTKRDPSRKQRML